MAMAALQVDVRLGLRSGFVQGYVTLVQRRVGGPPNKSYMSDMWLLDVAPEPGAPPHTRFDLFLEGVPLRLETRLRTEGVNSITRSEAPLLGAAYVTRWEDTRGPYRVHYAGLGRRVVTRINPLPPRGSDG